MTSSRQTSFTMASISMDLSRESMRLKEVAASIQKDLDLEGDEKQPSDRTSESPEEKPSTQETDVTLDGSFFGRMGIPYAVFALVYVVFRCSTLLAGYSWSRNSVAEMLDLDEPNDYTKRERIVVNVHAFLGLVLITAIAVQYLSASFFASKREELMRFLHRVVGRFLVALWPVCILFGAIYSLSNAMSSTASATEVVGTVAATITGVFSLANLGVGYFAIAHRSLEKRDYFLHKAAMFFSMHYAIGFTASILAVVFIQMLFWDSCFIASQGYALGVAGGFLFQTTLLVACMYCHDRRYFQKRVVRINLWMLAFHHTMFVLFAIGAFVIVSPEEGNCFLS